MEYMFAFINRIYAWIFIMLMHRKKLWNREENS